MSKFIATDIKVEVNSVNLSNWAFNVDTPSERPRVDASGFNSSGTKEWLYGQKEESVTIQFRQDFGSGGPHQTLQPIYQAQSTVPLSLLPDSDTTVGAANPRLSGTVTLGSYNGLTAALDEVAEISAEFSPATSVGLTWGTV